MIIINEFKKQVNHRNMIIVSTIEFKREGECNGLFIHLEIVKTKTELKTK